MSAYTTGISKTSGINREGRSVRSRQFEWFTYTEVHTYIHKFICLGGSEKATLKADVDPHFVKPRSLCRAKSVNQYTIFVTSEL